MQFLADEWRESGIEEGDIVLIHSSLKRLFKKYSALKIELTVEDVLDSFLKVVGESGTLLFPTFNFDFAKGIAFDISNTVSHMGALTEAARKHPDAVRTGHPLHSFVVIGAKANMFKDVNNFSSFGIDSPLGILHKMDGKIAILNMPEKGSMTFYHYIEEMCELDHRYHKVFTGVYVTSSGIREVRDYGMFVRHLDRGIQGNINPAGEIVWKAGLYKGSRPDQGSGLRVASAKNIYELISKILKEQGPEGVLYDIEGKK
ncbi:AAC(3) family N-acetyltransferase [uncultured Psychrobacter sp.]|uniref:AAC(3) family N-acetyltransferase n=1 Tax=uncultured Psychrobacter sp. TaxID=259303 RepID=UPI002619CB44|nr:AAC(3) family N-acetyltransferase [uncultured Psychrobacter sp.]